MKNKVRRGSKCQVTFLPLGASPGVPLGYPVPVSPLVCMKVLVHGSLGQEGWHPPPGLPCSPQAGMMLPRDGPEMVF